MATQSRGLFDLMEKEMELDERKKNPDLYQEPKPIPYANKEELKRKLQEKLIRAEIEARMSKDEAQEALTEQLQKMDTDEQKFGYESTNLYKFDEEDKEKVIDGLQGDDGMKLAENMIDQMTSLQTTQDIQVRGRTRMQQ